MQLIIVESPTKARTLSRFLGEGYDVEATTGHIKDLPKSKLGVDVENNFEPQYEIVAKRKETINSLKRKAKSAKQIYLATDPDREGEAIASHVADVLANSKFQMTNDKLKRIVFHEITKDAVEEAINSPREIDNNLVDAQTARRVLDRLVGYKLSPLLWRKVRRGLSAGRVQTVAVRLIVEREREIKAFKAEEYWEIYVEVSQVSKVPKVSKENFIVKLIKIGDKTAEVGNKDTADKIVGGLEKADYKVEDVRKKEVRKNPYPPFTTSTMTQAAARIFGWSAKRTMQVAQKLYEEGVITYHRTDSTYMNADAVSRAREFIGETYGHNYLPEKPRFFKVHSKVAQEAHEAIRPTDVNHQPSTINHQPDAKRLYDLIWRRFVACQMAVSIYDETVIEVEALGNRHKAIEKNTNTQSLVPNAYLLRASGQIMKFDGWRKLMENGKWKMENDTVLPQVEPAEALQLIKVDPQQKFTEPPPRYNEASLIKTLEKLGIGRPSTYAPIITTIQVRQYVEKEEGKFSPTPVGFAVNDFLVENFPDVFEYAFTAEMEGNLDKIADGKTPWVATIKDFWQPFDKKLTTVTEKSKRVKIEVEKIGRKCPECKEGELVIRIGRFGKFISCSRFPDCKYTEKYLEKVGMKCPECNKGEVIIKKSFSGKRFFGCSRYPDCKFASWKNPAANKNKPVTQ